jgi:hypothetical protein
MSIHDLVERDQEAHDDDHWIGRRPSRSQIAAFLIVGSLPLIIGGVQPIILGALVHEARLTASGLGWAITVEFLAIALGVSLAGALLPPRRLRLVGVTAAMILAAIDVYATRQTGLGVLANRALAGLAEGVLVWLTILMIARSATPARWSGLYFIGQAVLQVAFAALVPLLVMPAGGANGAFLALAATALAAGLCSLLLPSALDPLAPGEPASGSRERLPVPAIASLVGVFLVFAFFMGFLAYMEQLALQAGLTAQQAGLAIALALAASILGSGAAAILAKRLSYYVVFLVCLPVNLGVVLAAASLPHVSVFIALSAVYGLFWGFFMPFQAPFVIESDPSRRAVLLIPGVQSIGAAGGPLLCSFFVSGHEARGALVAASVCFLLAFVIATGLHILRLMRRGDPIAQARSPAPAA